MAVGATGGVSTNRGLDEATAALDVAQKIYAGVPVTAICTKRRLVAWDRLFAAARRRSDRDTTPDHDAPSDTTPESRADTNGHQPAEEEQDARSDTVLETPAHRVHAQTRDDPPRDGTSGEASPEIGVLTRRMAELEQTVERLTTAARVFAEDSDPRNRG